MQIQSVLFCWTAATNTHLNHVGIGAVTVTFNEAITTETTATIETTQQTIQQTTQKITFGFGYASGGGFSTTSTFDQKWTQSTKLSNTKTTTTTVTPQLITQGMCPSTAVDNTCA